MTDDTKIEKHIDECKRRIDTIMGYMASNSDANKSICDENISVLTLAIQALEKQMPKKPILCMNETTGMFVDYADGQGEYKTQMNNWWKCPCCNSVVGQRVVFQDLIHDQKKKKFCEDCGQKIEW